MFDLSIVRPIYLITALLVFSGTYAALGIEQKHHHGRRLPYAGTILIGVIAIAAFSYIESLALRTTFLSAALLTALLGQLDETYFFSARTQLIAQIVIICILLVGGWTIPHVSNPIAEGVIHLDTSSIGTLVLPGSVLAFAWLFLLMNSLNWIDGNDGLAGSIVAITQAALVIISLLPATQDPQTLVLALIGLAASLAFTIWNFPPAKIYLGTTGSWFLALYTGLVAIIGGGKIVTSLIVLAIPVLDSLFVIARRLYYRQPVWQGDTKSHLHHRLRGRGYSPRSITIASIAITSTLATVGVLASTPVKIGVLGLLAFGFLVSFLRIIPISFAFARRNPQV